MSVASSVGCVCQTHVVDIWTWPIPSPHDRSKARLSRFCGGHDRLWAMSDRTPSDGPTESDPAATPKPKPKVTRARATVAGKPPKTSKAPIAPIPDGSVAAAPADAAPLAVAPAAVASSPARAATNDDIPEVIDITDGGLDVARAVRVNVTQGGINQVEATHVDVRQGGINKVAATHVNVRQGGISRVHATDVAVSMGGIAIARADRVSAEMGGIGIALAGDARVSQSFVRALLARDVRIDQGAVWNLMAGRVTFDRPSFAGVVIAGRVDGTVKPLLDWRGALALAGVVGLVLAIVRRR